MTHATSDSTSLITILTTRKPNAARKTIAPDVKVIESYSAGKWFQFRQAPFDGWDELADLLGGVDGNELMVLGTPTAEALEGWHRRLKHPKPDSPAALVCVRTRLLPLDIDGLEVRGIAPATDPEDCVQAALEALGEPFTSTTCWWNFTASQRPRCGLDGIVRLRLRLIFLLRTPWRLERMTRWARAQDPQLHLDASICSGVQPIYLAPPSVVGGPDPIPVRSGVHWGEQDLLEMPEPQIPETWQAARRHGVGGVWRDPADDPLDLIGEPPAGQGCYGGIRSATLLLVKRQGKRVSDEEVMAMVREKVASVDWDPGRHPPHYVAEKISDRSLSALIQGAREKCFCQQKLFRLPPPGRRPVAPTDDTIQRFARAIASREGVGYAEAA